MSGPSRTRSWTDGTQGDLDLVMDVGTSAVKGALVALDGTIVATVERPLPPPDGVDGVSEQDANAWWTASCDAATELVRQASTSRAGAPVRRIVLTGQMQTLTLVDADGVPIRATLSYGDVRATREADEVLAALGEETLRGWTGNDTDASSLLAKTAWLLRHEPDTLQRAHGVHLGAADHVAYRASGSTACDTTTASTTGLFDVTRGRALPDAAFTALGLRGFAALLPPFVPGGTQVGRLTAAASAAWGVAAGTPVHVAPGDAGSSTLGAGAGVPGVASIYLGTSGWLAFTSDRPGRPDHGVFTLAHPAPGAWFQVAPLLTAAGNLAWFRNAVRPDEPFDDLVEQAMARPATPLVYLPYLAGERAPFRDPHLRGAFVGLSASTTRDDMARAVLEGVAFAYRHAAEALGATRSEGGGAEDAIQDAPWVVSGGGARSRAWMQTFADVLQHPIRIVDDATWVGVRGAWLAARVATGERAGPGGLAWHVEGELLVPGPAKDDERERRYRLFRAATDALRSVHGRPR